MQPKKVTKVVELLLDKGADVNAKTTYYETALMEAVGNCHSEVARVLLDKGADVTVVTANSRTALKIARKHDCKAIEALLKARGARE